MYDVNPGKGQSAKSIEDDFGGLFCIADDNTGFEGFFYNSADIAKVSSSSVQKLKADLSSFQSVGVQQTTWESTGLKQKYYCNSEHFFHFANRN